MRLRNSVLSVILATLLAGAWVVLPGRPALASPSCHLSTCEGLLAADAGCEADQVGVAFATGDDPNVPAGNDQPSADLYYSAACGAAWFNFDTKYDLITLQVVRLWTQPEYGGVNVLADEIETDGSTNYVSTMVSWQNSIRVCLVYYGAPCSGWR